MYGLSTCICMSTVIYYVLVRGDWNKTTQRLQYDCN